MKNKNKIKSEIKTDFKNFSNSYVIIIIITIINAAVRLKRGEYKYNHWNHLGVFHAIITCHATIYNNNNDDINNITQEAIKVLFVQNHGTELKRKWLRTYWQHAFIFCFVPPKQAKTETIKIFFLNFFSTRIVGVQKRKRECVWFNKSTRVKTDAQGAQVTCRLKQWLGLVWLVGLLAGYSITSFFNMPNTATNY